jgi:thymidine kinase
MFAEKTTELQRRGRRLERAGKKVGYFKPQFDDRYSEDEIVSHDGNKVPAINISNPFAILTYSDKLDVFLIDEIQFLETGIITVIKALLRRDKTIIVAGLDLDFRGEPFATTSALMGYAEEVVKLHAVCTECGNDAWVSAKREEGTERVQLGADDLYYPLCRKCFNQKGATNNVHS